MPVITGKSPFPKLVFAGKCRSWKNVVFHRVLFLILQIPTQELFLLFPHPERQSGVMFAVYPVLLAVVHSATF